MRNQDTDARLEAISRKLDIIIYLIGKQIKPEGEQKAEILKLDKLGFDRNEIATILGTTPGTVSVALSRAKKTKGEKSSGANK